MNRPAGNPRSACVRAFGTRTYSYTSRTPELMVCATRQSSSKDGRADARCGRRDLSSRYPKRPRKTTNEVQARESLFAQHHGVGVIGTSRHASIIQYEEHTTPRFGGRNGQYYPATSQGGAAVGAGLLDVGLKTVRRRHT